MDNHDELALFHMKYKASIKKVEELLAIRDLHNATALFDKMQQEANSVEISALDGFSTKLLSIHQNSMKKIQSRQKEFEVLFKNILEGCEAVLHNTFKDKKTKKETIELLSVHDGMAHYNGNAKVYREELIEFYNWFKGVYTLFEQLVESENTATLIEFLEELRLRAQKIEAKEVIHFVSLVNQAIMQEQTQYRLLLQSYQKSVEL